MLDIHRKIFKLLHSLVTDTWLTSGAFGSSNEGGKELCVHIHAYVYIYVSILIHRCMYICIHKRVIKKKRNRMNRMARSRRGEIFMCLLQNKYVLLLFGILILPCSLPNPIPISFYAFFKSEAENGI